MKNLHLLVIAVTASGLLAGCRDHGHDFDDHDKPQPAPKGVFAINGNHSVTLGWTEMEVGEAVGYQIHRNENDPLFFQSARTLYRSVGADERKFVDSPLVNNKQYYYRVVPVMKIVDDEPIPGTSREVVVGRPYDYSTISTIDYSEHIQPIFTSGCAVSGCHVGRSSDHNQDTSILRKSLDRDSTQFSLKSWHELMEGGPHGAVVVPFSPLKSHLVFHVNTDTLVAPVSQPHMPRGGFNLPVSQIQTLIRWISEGAKADDGEIAFSTYPQGKVLVTNQSEDLVAVIDVATNLVARYVQAGVPNVFTQPPQSPHNVVVDQAHGYFYVNLVSGGKVVKYQLSDHTKIGEVSGLLAPTQIALSGTGDSAFAAQFTQGVNSIRIINTVTMQLVGQLASMYLNKPHGVQLSPDRNELWVTGNLSDNLYVFNLQTTTDTIFQILDRPLGVGNELLPYQTAMTSDGRFVYISCQKSNVVYVYDRAMKVRLKQIPVGQFPLILAVTPDDQYVYVCNRNSNSVSVIRTGTDSVVATIPDVGPQPHGIDITRDGKYAYVSCENVTGAVPPHHPTAGSRVPGYVTVIDLTSNAVVRQIEVGGFAAGVAVVQ